MAKPATASDILLMDPVLRPSTSASAEDQSQRHIDGDASAPEDEEQEEEEEEQEEDMADVIESREIDIVDADTDHADFDQILNSYIRPDAEIKKHDTNDAKRSLLAEIEQYIPGDIGARGFTMKSPIHKLRYELDRRKDLENEQAQVIIYKSVLVMIVGVIEWLTGRFFKWINLAGWSAEIKRSSHQFDRPFRKLYLEHFRRRQSSPVAEIGFMLLSSGVQIHLSNSRGRTTHTSSQDHDEDILEAPPPRRPASRSASPDLAGMLGAFMK